MLNKHAAEATTRPRRTPAERLIALDIFRGIAVLLVLLFHFTARIPPEHMAAAESPLLVINWGWIGVFLFFVISGYCISETLSRNEGAPLFLFRRAVRIYPAYILAVTIAFILVSLTPVPEYDLKSGTFYFIQSSGIEYIANLLFLRELGFPWIDGVYWSLLVELKFYVLIAALYALVARLSRARQIFMPLSVVLAGIWLGAEIMQAGLVAKLLKHLTIAPYLPFFALGMLLNTTAAGSPPGRKRSATMQLALVTLICNAVLMLLDGSIAALLAFNGLVASLVLTVFHAEFRQSFERKLACLVPVGLISYSLYLFHNNIGLALIRELNQHMNHNLSILIATIVVLGISTLSYLIAEQFLSKQLLRAKFLFARKPAG